jgi:hypothetical protein
MKSGNHRIANSLSSLTRNSRHSRTAGHQLRELQWLIMHKMSKQRGLVLLVPAKMIPCRFLTEKYVTRPPEQLRISPGQAVELRHLPTCFQVDLRPRVLLLGHTLLADSL